MQGSSRIKRIKRVAVASPQSISEAKLRAVAYLRVSTEGQFSDGYGMEVQERAVRAFALSQGYELVDVISDCVSGATAPIEREGFGRVMELAGQGAFTILLLYKFDRLARNVLYAVTTVHRLRDNHGIAVRSVTEPIDTATPMGEMIFTVLASMAAQERQVIAERTYGGKVTKATKGGFAGGASPYGYERDKDGGLKICEREAQIVRRIFLERTAGETLQSIANGLNRDGIPAKRGGAWRHDGVHYILDNPKYRGAVEYLFQRHGGSPSTWRSPRRTRRRSRSRAP
jgi:site-specific DNA recombinase